MKAWLIVFGLLLFFLPDAYGQCFGGRCVAPPVVYQPQISYAPVTVMQPQVRLQPYQYQGSTILERRYHTPLRNLWFGRYRIQHQYAPVQRQQR